MDAELLLQFLPWSVAVAAVKGSGIAGNARSGLAPSSDAQRSKHAKINRESRKTIHADHLLQLQDSS
jgi:hypothetical protein